MRGRVAGLFGVVLVASCRRSAPVGRDAAQAANDAAHAVAAPTAAPSRNVTTALVFEEPRDVYTSSTPNPYVRFFATNISSSVASMRVTRVDVKHGADSIPIRVAAVTLDDGTAGVPVAIRAGERHLVTVSLDDSAHVLDAIHDEVEFAVSVDVDGTVRSVATRVARATRWPSRR